MKMEQENVKQALELMFQLGSHVDWNDLHKNRRQQMIDSPRLTGAHFREFLRCGGRMPLNDSPIRCVSSIPTNLHSDSWEAAVSRARYLLGGKSLITSKYPESTMMDNLRKPKGWKPRKEVKILRFEVADDSEGQGRSLEQSRILQLFELENAYSSPAPEVFALLASRTHMCKKPCVLFNAFAYEEDGHTFAGDMLIRGTDDGGYAIEPIYENQRYGSDYWYASTSWD